MVRTLECPSCGGTVQLKYERTLNAVCIQCLSILDASTPSLEILQKFEGAQRYQPKIPLGSRGKLAAGEYEAIGFQMRQIQVEGVTYEWAEYLLYNPYKGYRYLTEYNGHWNDIRTLRALPRVGRSGAKVAATYQGKTYKHFQTARAETAFVMGEFPWQIRVGETVEVRDFIAPPDVLSSEESPAEVVWSIGQYVSGAEIWKAFSLKGPPPGPTGIYANQPSPFTGRPASAWRMFLMLSLALVAALFLVGLAAPNKKVFHQAYSFTNSAGEPSFVTPIFPLKGREANVEISVRTDVTNDWAYIGLALINDDTGIAYDSGKEISYYYGRDSDGSWSEGQKSGSVTIPPVPPGNYYLRVEPEMEKDGRAHTMNYDLTVKHGTPAFFWFLVGFAGLLIPPVFTSIRAFSFENRRWAESDYGPLIRSSSSEEDD